MLRKGSFDLVYLAGVFQIGQDFQPRGGSMQGFWSSNMTLSRVNDKQKLLKNYLKKKLLKKNYLKKKLIKKIIKKI